MWSWLTMDSQLKCHMNRTLILLLFFLPAALAARQTDSLKVLEKEGWVWHRVLLIENDTIDGRAVAVYADDTTAIAYEKNYYMGYQNGVYRSYYPDGALMEKIIFQKSRRNGEYELRDRENKVLVKGEYRNDIRHGFWSDVQCRLYGRYKNGERHGKWKWYYQDRYYHVYIYKKGELIKKTAELPRCRFLNE